MTRHSRPNSSAHGATRLFYLTEKTTHVICDDFASHRRRTRASHRDLPNTDSDVRLDNSVFEERRASTQSMPIAVQISMTPTAPEEDSHKRLFKSCHICECQLNQRRSQQNLCAWRRITVADGSPISIVSSVHISSVHQRYQTKGKVEDANNNHEHTDERLQDAYDIQSEKVHLITPDWIIDCINASERAR